MKKEPVLGLKTRYIARVEEAEVVECSEVAFLEAPERIVGFLQRLGLYKHRG